MMKVSIWQQFSSNHSASFMVVGEFESVEWAQMVAEEMELMIADITAWWTRFDDWNDMERVIDAIAESGGLTPPEQKYKVQYGLEKWGKGSRGVSDWLQTLSALDAVRVFDRFVVINPAADTWMGPTPFDEILHVLGAKVAVRCEAWDSYFVMNLTCETPEVDRILQEPEPVKSMVIQC